MSIETKSKIIENIEKAKEKFLKSKSLKDFIIYYGLNDSKEERIKIIKNPEIPLTLHNKLDYGYDNYRLKSAICKSSEKYVELFFKNLEKFLENDKNIHEVYFHNTFVNYKNKYRENRNEEKINYMQNRDNRNFDVDKIIEIITPKTTVLTEENKKDRMYSSIIQKNDFIEKINKFVELELEKNSKEILKTVKKTENSIDLK